MIKPCLQTISTNVSFFSQLSANKQIEKLRYQFSSGRRVKRAESFSAEDMAFERKWFELVSKIDKSLSITPKHTKKSTEQPKPNQYGFYRHLLEEYHQKNVLPQLIKEESLEAALKKSNGTRGQISDLTEHRDRIAKVRKRFIDTQSVYLHLKTSVDLRFRKYEEVIDNLQNELYLIFSYGLVEELQEMVTACVDKLILILLFSDHDRLSGLLLKINSLMKVNVSKSDKNSENALTLMPFMQIIIKRYASNPSLKSMHLLSIAYAAIGQTQKSLILVIEVINAEKKQTLRIDAISTLLTVVFHFGNQSYYQIGKGDPKACQESYRRMKGHERVNSFIKILTNPIAKLSNVDIPQIISPEDCERVLTSLYRFYVQSNPSARTRSIDAVFSLSGLIERPEHLINSYLFRVVYMIQENYHLFGNQQRSSQLSQILSSQIRTQDTASTLLLFGRLTKLYDQGQFEQILQQEKKFTSESLHKTRQSKEIQNDVLRSHIYAVVSEAHKQLESLNQKSSESSESKQLETETLLSDSTHGPRNKDLSSQEESAKFEAISEMMLAVNSAYPINRIDEHLYFENYQNQQPNNNGQRTNKKGINPQRSIPVYYFELKLAQQFD